MSKRKPIEDHEESGRPTEYKAKFNKQVFKLCLLGATDEDIARFFEVSVTTINNWKREHPRFLASIRAGKEDADNNVANSLYKRAVGYAYDEVHVEKIDADGVLSVTDKGELSRDPQFRKKMITKEIPPDVNAQRFWLMNRRPDNWRDKTEVDTTVTIKEYNVGFGAESENDKPTDPKE